MITAIAFAPSQASAQQGGQLVQAVDDMIRNGIEYLLFGRGRIATTGVEACSFHVPEDGSGDLSLPAYRPFAQAFAKDV